MPVNIAPDELTITVKTTLKFHENRVKDILDTWFRLSPENVDLKLFSKHIYGKFKICKPMI